MESLICVKVKRFPELLPYCSEFPVFIASFMGYPTTSMPTTTFVSTTYPLIIQLNF